MDLNFSRNNESTTTIFLQKMALRKSLCFMLTPYLLSVNFSYHKNHRDFLQFCLIKGCKFIKELALNVIYFMLRDEEFEQVHSHYLQPMVNLYNNTSFSKIKKLVRIPLAFSHYGREVCRTPVVNSHKLTQTQ